MVPLQLRRLIRRALYAGTKYYCPICRGHFRTLWPAGVNPRSNAMCPVCGSLERHRLLWIAMVHLWEKNKISSSGRLLHVAPENCLQQELRKSFEYVSVNIEAGFCMVQADVTALPFPDGVFDAVICNHVLEHIRDDRKALGELQRVLRRNGWASIQVPMESQTTHKDPSIIDADARTLLFGQPDHVRQYGTDILLRLNDAGFSTTVLRKEELLPPDLLAQVSVECEREVWISTRER